MKLKGLQSTLTHPVMFFVRVTIKKGVATCGPSEIRRYNLSRWNKPEDEAAWNAAETRLGLSLAGTSRSLVGSDLPLARLVVQVVSDTELPSIVVLRRIGTGYADLNFVLVAARQLQLAELLHNGKSNAMLRSLGELEISVHGLQEVWIDVDMEVDSKRTSGMIIAIGG